MVYLIELPDTSDPNTHSQSRRTLYRVLIFAAAFLFSTGGVAIKSCSLNSWQVAGFRSGIAGLVLIVALPEARRGWNRLTFLAGIAYAATLVTFVAANKMTTSANAIFLQSTAPLYMLFLAPLVLKEKIRRLDVAVVAAVAVGAVLLLSGSAAPGQASSGPRALAGNAIAVLSGLAWALTMTALRWIGSRGNSLSVAALGNVIAFVACLPMALADPIHPDTSDILVLLYLGVFQIALAYIFLTRSIRHVRAIEAATLLLAEPVFNPLWSWLIRNERPGPAVLGGGAIIVLAAFCGTLLQSRQS